MGVENLPGEVRGLVEEHIETNTDVDVLLLVHRHPDGGWDAAGVAGALRIHPAQADGILNRMADGGLLRPAEGGYRYEPATARLEGAVDALAALHPTYRLAIADLIFSASQQGLS